MPAATCDHKNKASSEGALQQKLPHRSCMSPSSPSKALQGTSVARSLFAWRKAKCNFTSPLPAVVARRDGYFSGP